MKKIFALSALSLALWSCDNQEPEELMVPETYSFTNVDYSGQTTRLDMFSELSAYAKSAGAGNTLDASLMANMYSNTNNPFSDTSLNASTKQLKNKVDAYYQEYFEILFQDLADASANASQTASNGNAGVLSSQDGSKTYFVDENGVELAQLIEKQLMGALTMHQITNVYLGVDKMNVDNSDVTEGKGTAMQHHWDEAFGYWGVPTDFPSNTSDIRFFGKYTNSRNEVMNNAQTIMNAFLTGRAAIDAEEYEIRDEQIEIIRRELAKVAAGTAIHYLNGGLADLTDDALRCHKLSEAIGFASTLWLYPNAPMNQTELENLIDPIQENLYTVTVQEIEALRDALATAYGLENLKNIL